MQRNSSSIEDFENMLTGLSKPEVKELRHQDLMADQIVHSKNRNALSLWWILIPLYVIATLTMKTLYVKTSLKREVILFKNNNPILSVLLFLILPTMVIIFNAFFNVKRTFAGTILIILSSIVLFIYILSFYV